MQQELLVTAHCSQKWRNVLNLSREILYLLLVYTFEMKKMKLIFKLFGREFREDFILQLWVVLDFFFLLLFCEVAKI